MKPKCLILSGFGLNSENELAYAFSLAGAEPHIVHFSDISSGEKKMEDYDIFAIPGGWSFGDYISSGKILANKLKNTFRRQFEQFIEDGKPIIGICNGFQVLVKLGALPYANFVQETSLVNNANGRFENRWVFLKPQKTVCPYFKDIEFIHCPVRHGEGRFVVKEPSFLEKLEKEKLIAIKYVDEHLNEGDYPINPNGSPKSIAGICDKTGKILGIMPHPECSVLPFHFPRWTEGITYQKNSLKFFENIVNEAQK